MKELTSHIHSKGRLATLHSCGHNEKRIELFIEAGWDEWEPQTMNDTAALWEGYGDKIVIGVYPDPIDPEAPEDVVRQKAREFVDRFAVKGKPLMYSAYTAPPAFAEEVYVYSRKKYAAL